jgi:hypothetical protein
MPAKPDTSAAARAIDSWCAERHAEVTAAEIAAVRGLGIRNRARFVKFIRGADEHSDPFEAAGKMVKATFIEEGLMLNVVPQRREVAELLRRLRALPADSAARWWGDRLTGFRVVVDRIDRKFKQGDTGAGAEFEKFEPKYGNIEKQAAQAGVGACMQMVFAPETARVHAELALSGVSGSDDVAAWAAALRAREPWLTVRVLPNACALPVMGDPAKGDPSSTSTVGIWKDADGTVGATVTGGDDAGTLARTAAGETWTAFTVKSTGAGHKRVPPCTK